MEKELLSKYVAARRKQLGLTQKDLAALLSYTPQAVSRFESVNSAFPLEFSDSLCRALDCSLDDLFLRNYDNPRYTPLPFPLQEAGKLLEQKRKENGKSQEEVASACRISPRSLRNYETGKGSISLQFLDAFCVFLSITPSDLNKKEPEVIPLPVPPKPRSRLIPFLSVGGSVCLIGGAIALAVLLLPASKSPAVDPTPVLGEISSPASSDPAKSVEQASSTITHVVPSSSSQSIGQYGLEIVENAPNFLKVEYEKDSFSSVGEEIKLSLSDAFDDIDFDLTSDRDFVITNVPAEDSSISFEYEATAPKEITLTLKSANNGEGSSLNLRISGYWYYNIGFFSYHSEDPVYLPSDTSHKYPIVRGKVHSDFKSHVSVVLSQTNYAAFAMQLYNEKEMISFEEGIHADYIIGDAYLCTSRSPAHNWRITICDDINGYYIEIPKQIEIDNVMVTSWVMVQGKNGEYPYALEPLYVSIIH